MTFKSYYENLENKGKKGKREQILIKTGCSYPTFYKWLAGKTNNISKLNKEAIAEILQLPVQELFPETVEHTL